MTVSTVNVLLEPSARVLICTDVDAAGWHFAVGSVSQKGCELVANPATFYWAALARQIKVYGVARADPSEVTAADSLVRPDGSRAMALTRRQSEPYSDPAELDEALAKAHLQFSMTPSIVPDEWVSSTVVADTVEFWQADSQRKHRRLRHERAGSGWSRTSLWP
ncbi:MAG TPA: pyridoxine 5'-phosphate oxidase C-terminal domain-containing protein [Mycobacterium sp.]|nr:pyridoxine 5'-phosphate oxidase C-terminal domain-containing protein [Mycobacterium sp.]